MSERLLRIMTDIDIRKEFGQRIKTLRKQKKLTQKELSAKIDVRSPQLNKYECGLHAPPIEKLIKLAEVFDTTVDYLLTGDRADERPLHNIRLWERFKAMEDFDIEDQEAVLKLIDALIVKNKVEGAIKPFKKKAG